MNIVNIEIKAAIKELAPVQVILEEYDAFYHGEDHQIDTYFCVEQGRLKLRQGNIENALIAYQRPESKDLKKSVIDLQPLPKDTSALLQILTTNLGVWKVVDKRRKIYFIDNVKFHLDTVEGLGHFVEIEAISHDGQYTEERLRAQCMYYVKLLGIDMNSFIDQSYSDMID